MKAIIDRFEEDWAVLVVDGREQRRRRSELPPDAREGDAIDLETLALDKSSSEALRERIRRARKKLPKESA